MFANTRTDTLIVSYTCTFVTFTHTHTYIPTQIHTHTSTCMYVHKQKNTCTYVYVRKYVHVCTVLSYFKTYSFFIHALHIAL